MHRTVIIHVRRWKDISFFLLLIGMILSIVGDSIGFTQLIHFGTLLIVFSVIVQTITYWRKDTIEKGIDFICILILVISTFVSFFIIGHFSYERFVTAVCFLEIPLFITSSENKSIVRYNRLLFSLFTLLPLYYVFIFFSDNAYIYKTEYGITYLNDLTLGYSNPNETAIYLFCSIIILVSAINNTKNNKILNLFRKGEIAWLVFLIYKTRCRAIAIALVLSVFCYFFRRRKRAMNAITIVFHIFPILVIPIAISFNTLLSKISLFGESLSSGRNTIYYNSLSKLSFFTVLFGDSSVGFSNLHNAFLSIFATVGIIGATVFFVLIYKKNKAICNASEVQSFSFIGLLMLVFHSSVESAVMTAGSSFAALYIILYELSLFELKEYAEWRR